MGYCIMIKRTPAPHTICYHTSRAYMEAWESLNIWTRQIIIHKQLWMQKLKVSEITILLLLSHNKPLISSNGPPEITKTKNTIYLLY